MRRPDDNRASGAALLVTLVFALAIVLIAVSCFVVSRQEAVVSSTLAAKARADLGDDAAFAEAAHRLRTLTANDGYLVTLATVETDSGFSRYSFVSTPDAGGISHAPLFAGGRETRSSMPEFDQIETGVLADATAAAPEVVFSGETRNDAIRLPRLTGLGSGGGVTMEDRHPALGFVDLPPGEGTPFRTRYTYWIEDLEGYPNLDVLVPRQGRDVAVRYGYAVGDSRLSSDPLPVEGSETRFVFPSHFRGQWCVGQVAPGLSPREIALQRWPVPGLAAAEHPYFLADELPREPRRFARGLHGYRRIPLIPYGHGYADEGLPRHNLNELVANRDLAIAEIVERNLPDFAGRKGGFPDDEDYVGTLAANAIDYADADSLPALPSNTVGAGSRVFRGVDSYCPVNEFFMRFEYVGYEERGENDLVVFEAVPSAEFWNPSNRPAEMRSLRLRFRFLEPVQFQANSEQHEIRDEHREPDEPLSSESALTLTVPPNHCEVVEFGVIRWKVPVPRKGPVAHPVVQDLQGVKSASVRAHYEIYLGDDLVDQCGRPEPGDGPASPRYGFFFGRHRPVMKPGEPFMRMTAMSLACRAYGFNAGYGSHLGDPWMPYYSRSTGEEAQYRLKGTPGGRNCDPDKVTTIRPDWFKDQLRVRDWPDRGYDGPLHLATPGKDEEPPVSFNRPPDPADEAFAPWRISNLGRFHSVTELGNLHDPAMWIAGPATGEGNVVSAQSTQLFGPLRETWLKSLPAEAEPGKMWGGGNTLRIGRPEHARFDRPGMRASQWLDLFHTGYTGTNLGASGHSDEDLLRHYDPRDHQPPASAADPVASATRPSSLVYPPDLNAQGRFSWVNGHLNLNTAPTRFEIETLLRGPFVSSDLRLDDDDFKSPVYRREGDEETLVSGLRAESIPRIAESLMRVRPFHSPSHLARVLSHLLDRHGALPPHCNDAEAEETFARIFNTTTFSSRHFRIYTAGEVHHPGTGEILARTRRVREVFLRPVRDPSGQIVRCEIEVLSVAEF